MTQKAQWFLLLWLGILTNWVACITPNGTHVLMNQLLDGYDKRVRPYPPGGGPVVIRLNTFIHAMGSFNVHTMDYMVNLYFRMYWTDSRLAHNSTNETLQLYHTQTENIWLPDLFIPVEKDGRVHEITVPNKLLRLSPDGELVLSQRLTLVMSCQMYLYKFPMDNQTCRIQIESYGYSTADMLIEWREPEPIQVQKDVYKLPEFHLTGTIHGDCTAKYATGAFACIFGDLLLKRDLGFYIIQTYIPSILIVLLSWVTFWLDPESVASRVSLGVLTVLTMTTQASGLSSSLPKVSYVKAIDVWLSTCLIFVFASMLETAIVNLLYRRDMREHKEKERKLLRQSVRDQILEEELFETVVDESELNISEERKNRYSLNNDQMVRILSSRKSTDTDRLEAADIRSRALYVDRRCRIFFPSIFILFNTIYWPVFINLDYLADLDH
ncbi:unnamed protein product [Owenia fusiformis]|uniref:Uncharacterized protein n=1 Tax=Owenia fusiformis TaxID=6347 RepID=A0A8J1THD0_OWEFU|nr:unnamed protein product [Owenia fusiformis]